MQGRGYNCICSNFVPLQQYFGDVFQVHIFQGSPGALNQPAEEMFQHMLCSHVVIAVCGIFQVEELKLNEQLSRQKGDIQMLETKAMRDQSRRHALEDQVSDLQVCGFTGLLLPHAG